MDDGLRLGLLALIADLNLKTTTPEQALPLIKTLAATQPQAATALANSFLRAWVTARQPNRNQQGSSRYMVNGVMYYGSSPYGMQQQGKSTSPRSFTYMKPSSRTAKARQNALPNLGQTQPPYGVQ